MGFLTCWWCHGSSRWVELGNKVMPVIVHLSFFCILSFLRCILRNVCIILLYFCVLHLSFISFYWLHINVCKCLCQWFTAYWLWLYMSLPPCCYQGSKQTGEVASLNYAPIILTTGVHHTPPFSTLNPMSANTFVTCVQIEVSIK